MKLRKVTDYNKIPIGSNYFQPKHRLGYKNDSVDKPALSLLHPPPGYPAPWIGGISPAHSSPNYLPPQYYPFGLAYSPTPYGYHPQHPHFPLISSYHHGPSQSNPPAPIGNPAGLVPACLSIYQWCDKHNLGEEEHQGLIKETWFPCGR